MVPKQFPPSRTGAGVSKPSHVSAKSRKTQSELSPRPSKRPSQRQACSKFTRNLLPSKKLQVYVFGEGSAGELGLGPTNSTKVARPRNNPNFAGVISIATGGMHGIALTSDNKILTWGINDHATLARDTTWDEGLRDIDGEDSGADNEDQLNPKESTPAEVSSHYFPQGTEFVQVVAGDSASIARTKNGLVYGWGTFRDHNGVYGFTLESTTRRIVKTQKCPVQIPGLKNIIQISAGGNFALALDADGRAFAWGCGEQNELGHRLVDRRRAAALLPSLVGLPKRIKIVVYSCCR